MQPYINGSFYIGAVRSNECNLHFPNVSRVLALEIMTTTTSLALYRWVQIEKGRVRLPIAAQNKVREQAYMDMLVYEALTLTPPPFSLLMFHVLESTVVQILQSMASASKKCSSGMEKAFTSKNEAEFALKEVRANDDTCCCFRIDLQ